MKPTYVILFGFIVIIALSLSQAIFSYSFQSSVLDSGVQVVEVEIPLEHLVTKIHHHSMTIIKNLYGMKHHAARNEPDFFEVHREGYEEAVLELHRDFIEFEILLSKSMRGEEERIRAEEVFETIKDRSSALREQESLVFEAIEAEDHDRASHLTHTEEYLSMRADYLASLDELEAIEAEITYAYLVNIDERISTIIMINLFISLFLTLVIILILIVIRNAVETIARRCNPKSARTATKKKHG